MKILYILSGTGVKGGASKSFLSMARYVAAAGHEVAVVVPDGNGITEVLRNEGWKVLVVPYSFCALPELGLSFKNISLFLPRIVKRGLQNIIARKKVRDFASLWEADIIHDNTSVTDVGHHVARKLGLPHMIHIREYGWKDFRLVLPWIRQRLTAPFAYLTAITPELAEFRKTGVAEGHLRTVYNGVVGESQKDVKEEKSSYFLYAGRIDEAKGVGDLIDAYIVYATGVLKAGSQETEHQLLGLKLAGACRSESYRASLYRKIRDAGLDGYVEWLGAKDNMDEYYSEAAATVIPSFSEGFGRVMPEAMHAGCLCIARNSGGLAVQLENGRKLTGREIAFQFSTREELTELLDMVGKAYSSGNAYRAGGEFRKMIDDSRKTVAELYSCEANGRNMLNYYNYLLKDQK